MMIFVAILCTALTASSFALYYSVKKNLQMIETFEEVMGQIEESLEMLEVSKKKIERKLKVEVLSDEPVIRELIEDMKFSKRAVLLISEKLTGVKEDLDEEEPMS